MEKPALLIQVRLPEGCYHGMPEWPPAPFRLYQALVAAGLVGESAERQETLAPLFEWLETLPPPWIAVPPVRRGDRVDLFMPNNDLDTVGGDPRLASKIRGASKTIAPWITTADQPLAYCWSLSGVEDSPTDQIKALADQLYQFGRGVDMAFATAEVLPEAEASERLRSAGAVLYMPTETGVGGSRLRCPVPGSYASLRHRHHAQRQRLAGGHLTQAPPARFLPVTYNAAPRRLLFDLVASQGSRPQFHPVPLPKATGLVEGVRDRLAQLLAPAFGQALVERVVIGRGANAEDKHRRIGITGLPSIGSPFADHAIRRVLITVPPNCPIPAQEVEWAAGAVHLGVNPDGEITDIDQPQLVRATDHGMLAHYGVGRQAQTARVWRTVTPVVVPVKRPRGRVTGAQRGQHESEVAGGVLAALRHAGVKGGVERIRVQREPFEARGVRSDRFEAPDRFEPRRRYHVEIRFETAHQGPLALGDGRFLGLGLFAPVRDAYQDVFSFSLPTNPAVKGSARDELLRGIRRALMALARDDYGQGRKIPKLFSGHEADGGPSTAAGNHQHLFLAAADQNDDGLLDRVLVLAPWVCDRSLTPRLSDRRAFERVVSALEWVNLGRLGRLHLTLSSLDDGVDSLLGTGHRWESVTPYRPTRHPKRGRQEADIQADVVQECRRRGLPRPSVRVLSHEQGPKGGNVRARVQLEFSVTVCGALLLGRGSHRGEGLFARAGAPGG